MGYEVAGGMGAKLAASDREIFVMVGDGNYLMMAQELVTAVQEGIKMIVVLLDNHGFASIGGLSESVGSARFGTEYRYRSPESGRLDGRPVCVDFAANARSLGAQVIEARDIPSLEAALGAARAETRTTVITIETDIMDRIPGYAWWDVAVAETSEMPSVREARTAYIEQQQQERYYLHGPSELH
jgi:3D-(3,5/4)-trihydroxycyclohexane-1,2-dione acylhydrolase (decyclizing)